MFNFLKRPGAEGRGPVDRRRARGPITIGFEQLEGREMLSGSGIVLTISPSEIPPLRRMPRPIIGRFNPEATGEVAVSYRPKSRPGSDRQGPLPWPLASRFRFGFGAVEDEG